jgi:hypothetical protein
MGKTYYVALLTRYPELCATGVLPCRACGEHMVRKTAQRSQPSTYLTSDKGLKDRVRVKFRDRGGCTGGVVSCMQVADLE